MRHASEKFELVSLSAGALANYIDQINRQAIAINSGGSEATDWMISHVSIHVSLMDQTFKSFSLP